MAEDKYPLQFRIGNMIYKKAFFIYETLYFFYKRFSDNSKIKELKKIIKPGMTVLDIGANIGFYSKLFSKLVGAEGRVYSFEPDEENFEYLKKNTKECNNVVINKMAVSDKSGKMKLYISDDLNVDHNVYDNGEGRKTCEIDAVSLDDYFIDKDIDINFIKIDVQGFDYYAILGGEKTISKSKKVDILSEFWPFGLHKAGVGPYQYLELIKRMGFKVDLDDGSLSGLDEKIDDKMFILDFFASKS